MKHRAVMHMGCDKGTQGPLEGGKRLFRLTCLGCALQA